MDNNGHPWMQEALALAGEAALWDEVPIGAILVRNGEVLGRGYNRREATHRTTAHAELLALEDFNHRYQTWRLPPGSALYVTAEPCLMCTGALLWGRLDHLYYGCEDPRGAGYRSVASAIEAGVFDHRLKTVQGGIFADAASDILKTYFRRKRS